MSAIKNQVKGNHYLKFLIIHSVTLASSNAAAAAAEARAFLSIASWIQFTIKKKPLINFALQAFLYYKKVSVTCNFLWWHNLFISYLCMISIL